MSPWPQTDRKRAMVAALHGSSESTSAAVHDAQPVAPGRRALTPFELHEQRVAWGKLWGARISQATKEWKGEL